MALPPGFLEEIRSRVSLAQVVGRRVTWDARKTNTARGDYWAPCPFHQERTASFHVEDAKGFYYCFGCHAKGDAVTFLREAENFGFMEAVEALAREAGMEMPVRDPAAGARAEAARGLSEAMEAAVQFYCLQLNGARATSARDYLARRGLTPETQARFELGYAPEGRTNLLEHLTGKGFAPAKLAEAGLVGLPEVGGPYDRFRGRLMFPIRDARGRAIAFGARALRDDQQPKYLNSPETPLFDKGRSLYNLAAARSAAGKTGTVLVVEGYMDAIALAQAGLAHAVAPLGTAITEAQLELVWRLAPEPVVALDGDAAGLRAAERLTDLALPLLQAGRGLRFVLLPSGQDPDDVIRQGGARAMEALIAASRPMVDLIWARETAGMALDSPERRAALDARLRRHLARIGDASIRAYWQAEIRERRAALFAPPGARRPPAGGRGRTYAWRTDSARKAHSPASAATKASLLAQCTGGPAEEARIRESAILFGCLNHPELAHRVEERLERTLFLCHDLEEIRITLLSALAEHLHGTAPALARAVAERLGRDPRTELAASGHVRANPYLRPEAEPDRAAQAIEEELTRHAAWAGIAAEVREAEDALRGEPDERLTWRLKQAAQATHEAAVVPLARITEGAETTVALSAQLQELIDRQVWKKPSKPRS